MSVVLALTPTPDPAAAQPNGETVDQQIAAAAEKLEIVIEQYNDLQEELRDTRGRVAALDQELAALERTMNVHRGQAAQLAVNAYRGHGAQPLAAVAALLTATTDDLLGSLLVLNRLSRDQRRVISELAGTRDRLAAARAAAEAATGQQRVQERQLAVRRQHIEGEIRRLTRMRDRAGVRDDEPPLSGGLPDDLGSGPAAVAVRFAYAQLGKRYQWGGEGPDGYDCSGLTAAAWRAAGVELPHNAARQFRTVRRISRAERRPGDLIFYYPDIHHVGIYIGDGRIIHAPRTGKSIRIDRVDYQPIHGYGRPA